MYLYDCARDGHEVVEDSTGYKWCINCGEDEFEEEPPGQPEMKQPTELSPEALKFNYLTEAAWYYYRAADSNETLVSALHRTLAQHAQEALIRRGLPVPDDKEIYQYASFRWPADRLHERPWNKTNS